MSIHPTHYPTFYRCACELLREAQLKNILISKKKKQKSQKLSALKAEQIIVFTFFFFPEKVML